MCLGISHITNAKLVANVWIKTNCAKTPQSHATVTAILYMYINWIYIWFSVAVLWLRVLSAAELWERNVEMSCMQVRGKPHKNCFRQPNKCDTLFLLALCFICFCLSPVKQHYWKGWRWISTCGEFSMRFKSKFITQTLDHSCSVRAL